MGLTTIKIKVGYLQLTKMKYTKKKKKKKKINRCRNKTKKMNLFVQNENKL